MTTDVHPSDVLVPRVLWAQHHDKIFITLEVFGVKDEVINITPDRLIFQGTRSTDNAKFAVDLEFYAPINIESSQKNVNPRNVAFVLQKEDDTQSYWPRLVKEAKKLHYISIDFSKWIDEDEEGSKSAGGLGGDIGDFSSFDPSQFSKYDNADEEDDFNSDDVEEKEQDD